MISFKNTIQMLTITPVWGNSKYNFDCNGVACMSQKEQENTIQFTTQCVC